MTLDETSGLLERTLSGKSVAGSGNGVEKSEKFSRAEVFGLIAALSGIVLAYADGSMALAIHERIASEFESLAYSSWVITGFTIGHCVTLPLYAQLSDSFGRHVPLLWAYSIFCLGCAISACGQFYWQVIAGRIIAGCGGSGMVSLVTLIIIDIAPPLEVAIWRSYVNLAVVLGNCLGGPIGGFLTETIGWRWSFMGQVPIAVLCCLCSHWSLASGSDSLSQNSQGNGDTVQKTTTLETFDFPGTITLALSVTSLLMAIDLKTSFGWDSPFIIATIIIGLISAILFIAFEGFGKRKPLIPLGLFRTEVAFFCLTTSLLLFGRWGFLAQVAPYFIRTQDVSITKAGSFMGFSSFGIAAGSLVGGQVVKRYGSYKKFSLLSLVGSIFCAIVITFRWSHHIGIVDTLMILPASFFAGLIFSFQFIGVTLMAPKEYVATTVCVYYMSQEIGITLGVGFVSSILRGRFQEVLAKALVGVPDNVMIIGKVLEDSSFAATLSPELQTLISQSYLHVFWVVPGIYALSQMIILLPMLSTTDKRLF